LSITLAILNILPIPALDGGHIVFIIIEGIIGREVSIKIKMAFQQVGFILLLSLMAYVFYNDLMHR
jgi:regulator of sigma E protease